MYYPGFTGSGGHSARDISIFYMEGISIQGFHFRFPISLILVGEEDSVWGSKKVLVIPHSVKEHLNFKCNSTFDQR